MGSCLIYLCWLLNQELSLQPHITCRSAKHINHEKFQCHKNAIDQNSMKPFIRYLCIKLAYTGMHTQISRGFERQRGITMQVGLMDVRPAEDIWDPQVDCIFLNKTPNYLCICSIYSRNNLSPTWGKGRKRKDLRELHRQCNTHQWAGVHNPCSTTEVSCASKLSSVTTGTCFLGFQEIHHSLRCDISIFYRL